MKTYNYTFYNDNLAELIDYNLFKTKEYLLVQIFCGHDCETLKLISDTVLDYLPQAICIGTTTDGEINASKISTLKTVISISVFENTFLKANYLEGEDSFQIGYEIAKSIVCKNTKLIISFTGGIETNAEEYLKGIQDFDNTIMVCGGVAGDNGVFEQTFVSLGKKVLKKGYVAVSLNSDILKVSNAQKFDWVPIGLEHTINKVKGNRIYEISGMKPSDFYKKYLGESIAQTEFPLIIEKNGIPTARAVLKQHEDGSLSCGGNLEKGDKVKLGFGDAQSILRNPLDSFYKVFKYPTETFFIYSCMARRRYIRNLIKLDVQPLAEIAPTSGFFTYAEFFHKDGHNELLNQTLTIVALSEGKEQFVAQKIQTGKERKSKKDASFAKTLKSLSHLIQESSNDYQKHSKSLNETKQYSQKLLASQKQFLKHAIHETNTPLSIIMANIELYEMKNGKNEFLTNIEVAIKNLFSIYDDLSYLVKKDQIKYPKHKIDLNDFIRCRVDFFTPVAKKANSKLILDTSNEHMYLLFNESKLQRIIDNNLTNAIKYTYENEAIYVKVIKKQENLKFSIYTKSKKIQDPKKIFKEYYREEETKDGFGLGLNLVKRICDEEQVKIELNSNENFTSFTYTFKGNI